MMGPSPFLQSLLLLMMSNFVHAESTSTSKSSSPVVSPSSVKDSGTLSTDATTTLPLSSLLATHTSLEMAVSPSSRLSTSAGSTSAVVTTSAPASDVSTSPSGSPDASTTNITTVPSTPSVYAFSFTARVDNRASSASTTTSSNPHESIVSHSTISAISATTPFTTVGSTFNATEVSTTSATFVLADTTDITSIAATPVSNNATTNATTGTVKDAPLISSAPSPTAVNSSVDLALTSPVSAATTSAPNQTMVNTTATTANAAATTANETAARGNATASTSNAAAATTSATASTANATMATANATMATGNTTMATASATVAANASVSYEPTTFAMHNFTTASIPDGDSVTGVLDVTTTISPTSNSTSTSVASGITISGQSITALLSSRKDSSTKSLTAEPTQAASKAYSSLGWVAAPVLLGIALLISIVLVVFLFLRKRGTRRARKRPYEPEFPLDSRTGIPNPTFTFDPDETERPPPSPVSVGDFVRHVDALHRDTDYGFASEFTLLGKLSPQHPKTAAELPENRTKNRFTNVLPFDHSRVKLIPVDDDESGGSDYINASFLPGFSSRREFIAAQGPMRSTVDDFWRMIWEYNVTTVVMLTNLFEKGREKCTQYWPEQNDPIYYGDVQVELKSESSLNCYKIRVFNVTMDQKARTVVHYQFLDWYDHVIPEDLSNLLAFVTEVRNSLRQNNNQPLLVHCSAGVGRTGTYIAIDHALQLLKHRSTIDLFGLLLDMRNYRTSMVQSETQYVFAHECIKHAIECGYHQGKELFLTNLDRCSTGEGDEECLYENSLQKDRI